MNLKKQTLPQVLDYMNFEKGRGKEIPTFIVIHIVGRPGITAESAIQHFHNPSSGVSSHYLTKRNGEIIQFVEDMDTAYVNGIVWQPSNKLIQKAYLENRRINCMSIGIEHEGSEYEDITEAQYKATAELIQELSRKWGIPLNADYVIPHHSIRRDKVCPGKISIGKILELANAPIIVKPDIPTPIFTQSTKAESKSTQMPMWMKYFLDRSKLGLAKLGFYGYDLGVARSPKWSKMRKAYLKKFSNCAVCNRKGKLLKANQVHHIFPVNAFPELELIESNYITLCRRDHEIFGHYGSYFSYNQNVEKDAKVWKERVLNRP